MLFATTSHPDLPESLDPMNDNATFTRRFHALTKRTPLAWQARLYDRMVRGEQPDAVDIPTGLGKTATIAIWVLALAEAPRVVPRRLAYVVNRRTVVDQATREAEKLLAALKEASETSDASPLGVLRPVAAALRALAASEGEVLAISTLRGEHADNGRWRQDPARPAIVLGTVDMIGSRLLFSGYGASFRTRPTHAGLLGQDTLLVHDEAHLEPAFQHLIEALAEEQRGWEATRPLRVMALTATPRGGAAPIRLELPGDLDDDVVRGRYLASKALNIIRAPDVATELTSAALRLAGGSAAVVVFARTLELVDKVSSALAKKVPRSVAVLTGTMRGHERERLLKQDGVFARFDPEPEVAPVTGPVFLVCTSAGEVGVNLSADHMVSDLSTWDSMAQRLGRVNRFGGKEAEVRVVVPEVLPEKTKMDRRLAVTLGLLERLPLRPEGGHDASPGGLASLQGEERLAGFPPPPVFPPVTDVLLDAWALTTPRALPGRPAVTDWLHGRMEWELPTVTIAWRREADLFKDLGPSRGRERAEEVLDVFPLKPHELLTERADRALGHLVAIGQRAEKNLRAWRIYADGRLRLEAVGALARLAPEDLRDNTLVLPASVGGLSPSGLLDGSAEAGGTSLDVADEWAGGARRRMWDGAEEPPSRMRRVARIDVAPDGDAEEDAPDLRYWTFWVEPHKADDDGSRFAVEPQRLAFHLAAVRRHAEAIVERLHLGEEARAVVLAAAAHDLGKDRPVWQRAIGNPRGEPLAKSGRIGALLELGHYRHELGSLHDLDRDPDIPALPEAQRALALHLIAAHHGRARPGFPVSEGLDPGAGRVTSSLTARDVLVRYEWLQALYGRWGLAWLESLVRAADALGSREADPEVG